MFKSLLHTTYASISKDMFSSTLFSYVIYVIFSNRIRVMHTHICHVWHGLGTGIWPCCIGFSFYNDATQGLLNIDYSDTKWPQMHLDSPASRLFVQQFAQDDVKGNIIFPYQWPIDKAIRRWPAESLHKGHHLSEKLFIFWRDHTQILWVIWSHQWQ